MSHIHVGSRPSAGRRAASSERGRRCTEPSCSTRLSRYNTSDRCFAHAPVRFPRIRGRVVDDAS